MCAGKCNLDISVFVEQVYGHDGQSASLSSLYPFNALRNRALGLSSTPAVLLLDADFMPSPIITDEYHSTQGHARITRQLQQMEAIVVPTLQTISTAESDAVSLALQAASGNTCNLRCYSTEFCARERRPLESFRWQVARRPIHQAGPPGHLEELPTGSCPNQHISLGFCNTCLPRCV